MDTFILVPSSAVPKGYIACDGIELQIADQPELFSAFAAVFGGDGGSTFMLPNLISDSSVWAVRIDVLSEDINFKPNDDPPANPIPDTGYEFEAKTPIFRSLPRWQEINTELLEIEASQLLTDNGIANRINRIVVSGGICAIFMIDPIDDATRDVLTRACEEHTGTD